MQTKLTQDTHKRTYILTWEPQELDVRPYPYSRTGRVYQPQDAVVEVRRSFDCAWDQWSVRLRGFALKKDGKLGAQAVDEKFYSHLREAPRALQDAVAELVAFLNHPDVSTYPAVKG